jgi:2-keto-4-pentenoate hydratase
MPFRGNVMGIDQSSAIERFWQAYNSAEYVPPGWVGRLSVDEAHDVQLGVIARRAAAGERQVGWKVGLTAAAIQRQFGFTSRCSAASWRTAVKSRASSSHLTR